MKKYGIDLLILSTSAAMVFSNLLPVYASSANTESAIVQGETTDDTLPVPMITDIRQENGCWQICWEIKAQTSQPDMYHIYFVNTCNDMDLDAEKTDFNALNWTEIGTVPGSENTYLFDPYDKNVKPGDVCYFRICAEINGKLSRYSDSSMYQMPSNGPCDVVCLNKSVLTVGIDKSVDLEAYFPEMPENKIVRWESSNPGVAVIVVSQDMLKATITGLDYGTTTIKAISETGSYAECIVTVPKPDLGYINIFDMDTAIAGTARVDETHIMKLTTDANGNFTDAVILDANGQVDTDMDYYISNIMTGKKNEDGTDQFYSLVFTDGKWDTSYDSETMGAYKFQGDAYMVAGGVINQNANGLLFTGDTEGWKFLAAGRVVTDNAGLVSYMDKWFWIDDLGSCDKDYAAIVKWSGSDFLVHGGMLRTDFTGFTYDPQYPDKWYHIENGQVWGNGTITDQSIDGVEMTKNVVDGMVLD